MPLLHASRLPAHVISVFAAGKETIADWHPDDLSLRQPGHYGLISVRAHCTFFTTLFMERIASHNMDKLSFTHVFPGLVITPAFNNSAHPLWFKVVWFLLGPIAKLFSVSAEEIGERILFLTSTRYPAQSTSGSHEKVSIGDQMLDVAVGSNGVRGGGAYSCGYDGETNAIGETYKTLRKESTDDVVWEHTMAVFRAIEAGETFKN